MFDISGFDREVEHMSAKRLLLVMGAVLVLSNCSNGDGGDNGRKVAALEKKVGELEAKVTTLTARDSDLALKARIISNQIFASPLDRFFGSDEFWENPYDSGQADCAKRCTATLQSELKICDNAGNPSQCRIDAVSRASTCQTRCSTNNPPPIP